MTTTITYSSETKAEVSPEVMAKAFWGFDAEQQAQFFLALHKEVRGWETKPYGLGEMQWCYMKDEIKKLGKEATEMYLALSVFAYEHFPHKSEL